MKPFEKRPITWRRVADLCIHPAVKDDVRLKANDPRYLAMQAAWREAGTLPPLYTTPDGQIVDGRHRYWFAMHERLEEVPCIDVESHEVVTMVIASLAGRNHLTKGQRAYLAIPKLQPAFEAARQRRLDILKSGGLMADAGGMSIENFAALLGLSREILFQGRRLHEQLEQDTKFDFSADGGGKKKLTLREYFEPRILDDANPMSLGDALKGVGYKLSDRRDQSGSLSRAARNSHLSRVVSWWRQTPRIARHWAALPPEGREEVVARIEKSLEALPVDLLQEMGRSVRAAVKARQAEDPAAA